VRIRSIRRFLLWTLLPAVVLGAGAGAVWTYFNASHEVEELFDAELAQSARVLAGLTSREMLADHAQDLADTLARSGMFSAGDDDASPLGHPYETKLSFRIRLPDGTSVFGTPGAPARHGLRPERGYAWMDDGEFRWRIFTLRDDADDLWIEVGQREDIRDELAGEIAVDLFVQSLLAVPLLAFIVPALVVAAFAPVRRIARNIDARAPSNLHPVDTDRVPGEVRSLVDALNRMFSRLSSAFEAERRFTADAAHELRTPIAGMLVHAENARLARSEEARAASMDRVCAGIRRMQRLVEQLLTLSRLDPEAGLGDWQPVDLGTIAGEEIAQIPDRSRQPGVQLELDGDSDLRVPGNATMLGVLLRNVLDNALRHTPADGQVTVRVEPTPEGVALSVSDTGPGIPAELRQRVLERFYRAPGQAGEGSGLGLSIVRRIADIHGAQMELIDNAPGLTVRLQFPRGRARPTYEST
jgi:two-component system sensor histidine kinase QseC